MPTLAEIMARKAAKKPAKPGLVITPASEQAALAASIKATLDAGAPKAPAPAPRELGSASRAEVARLREALQRLADCDWVITPHDRMDAVREIAREALAKMEAARRLERERDEARAMLAELRPLPASAGDASPSRDARGYLHEAGVVGALRERLDRVTGLLRDVERETRQPSERFDEVWQEVREVLRG